MKTVTPKSRRAWRTWLERNHAAADEAWVVFYKRGVGKPTLSYNDAVEEALCFGWVDGLKKSLDGERYTHRFTPRKPGSKWSESNKTRVARLMKAGAMAPRGLALVEEAKRNGQWAAASRPDVDLSMPDDLAARLKRSKAAAAFFESLAPSYQRQFIAWIVTAKRDETRKKRLEKTMELLKKGEKLGMV